jgi:cell division protein FtsW
MSGVAQKPLPVDGLLLVLTISLLFIGTVAITSASIEYADHTFGDAWHHAKRHLFYTVIAAIAAIAVYRVPVRFWEQSNWLWLLVCLALLTLVLIPGIGKSVNGSQRWLPIGPLTLQPSEFVKAGVILYMAGYLVRHGEAVRTQWKGFVRPMGVLGIVSILLLAEPDFGATVIVMATAAGMLFIAGMRLVCLASVLALLAAGVVALVVAAPYRLARLTAYTDPWADPYGSGFQLIQSLIAFGRGEWFGVGLGNSVQKLFYLPEAHTDFVFSIWAEETGLVGALVLIALFAALIGRLVWIGWERRQAGDDFAAYVVLGVALMFSGQAFVNMGVSSGLLPTKGLTLPLVSYGGTSLITSCCLLAMVLRIQQESVSRGRKR